MVTLARLPRPDGPVDLPLVMLPGLPEYGQEHDPPISSTPSPDPLTARPAGPSSATAGTSSWPCT